MKAEWKSALEISGALCVMTCGEVLMLLWCANSWVTPLKVSDQLLLYKNLSQFYLFQQMLWPLVVPILVLV